MNKNRLSQLQSRKQETEEEAQREAKQQLRGEGDAWEGEEKTDRISMRIEPSLKKEFEKNLPRFASISDAVREYMIRVVRGQSEV